jgi:SpoVK/Ycf46/Vps4 family AAA+-type ATPase
VGALSAVIVGGPIRGGKTFIFEAVAAEMDMPVLKLGNIRSQWFGQTEVIVAKLRRILRALPSWLIIVDEADALFGRITNEMHATERRLVTQFQEMMSDPELTNKGTWLLMTARIDQLSADIRGEGRGGDLIIPVLDPDDCDRAEFVNDLVDLVSPSEDTSTLHNNLMEKTTGWYAGRFSAVRRAAEAYREILGGNLTSQELLFVIEDTLPPDIEKDRRIQELNALLNCTSRRLLPDKYATGAIQDHRSMWRKELDSLLQRSD